MLEISQNLNKIVQKWSRINPEIVRISLKLQIRLSKIGQNVRKIGQKVFKIGLIFLLYRFYRIFKWVQ